MTFRAPYFFRESGSTDVVAEFRRFFEAVGDQAARVLAELAEMRNFGPSLSVIKRDSAATRVTGLYCRKVGAWSVFYVLSVEDGVTVLYVACHNPHSFEALEN